MGYRISYPVLYNNCSNGTCRHEKRDKNSDTKHTQPLLESKEPKENIPHSNSLLMIRQGLTSILMSPEAL